jgi:hypothetical protein
MVLLNDVFKAFKSKITEDDWGNMTTEDEQEDLTNLLDSSIPYFKFPRCSLEHNSEYFLDPNMGSSEIQLIANYMRFSWYSRLLYNDDTINPIYDEKDYSPSQFLDKLLLLLTATKKEATSLEQIYYRSINGKPFDFNKLTQN